MAKSIEQHEKDIVKVIKDNKLMFKSHIFGYYLDIKSSQFYNLGLEKSEMILEALRRNRGWARGNMLAKWIEGDNAELQKKAYNIIAEEEAEIRAFQTRQINELVGKDGEELVTKIEVNIVK